MNRFKRILCAVLSVCMLSMPVAFSVTATEDISSLEQQLQELEQKNSEYQAILDKTQADIEEKEEYKNALVSKIEVLDDKIELTRSSIAELNSSIDQKQAEIEQANLDIEEQMDALCERLRTIYMAGSASNLEIILGAKDFSDFIDKMELVKTLSNYDKELIEDINSELELITEQKAELEAEEQLLQEQQASLEADQSELNGLLEENDELLRGLYAASEEAHAGLEHAAHASEEIENQIAAYYAELAKQEEEKAPVATNPPADEDDDDYNQPTPTPTPSPAPSVPSGGGYVWPCPGFYYLSSPWQEDRYSYNHGGIDIAGGGIMGTPVLAADSGTVVSSCNSCSHNWGKYGSCGCGGGYGNYVMIDHGNGKMTVYAHCSSINVYSGQYVSKGQTIGYVGTTGYSTGPHLHYECRYYGTKYNPMTEY